MKPPLGHGLVFEIYRLDNPPEWRWRLWDARGTVVVVSGYASPDQEDCEAGCCLFAHDVSRAEIRFSAARG